VENHRLVRPKHHSPRDHRDYGIPYLTCTVLISLT
jgi:hypothetical protein